MGLERPTVPARARGNLVLVSYGSYAEACEVHSVRRLVGLASGHAPHRQTCLETADGCDYPYEVVDIEIEGGPHESGCGMAASD
jgi:hypothetical protein